MFTPFAFVKSEEVAIVYDPDAQNFFTATGITNTGLRSAVNQLVLDLKSNSVWTPMDIIYPFVADNLGALSTQFSYNLKNTGSFQGTFSNPLTNSNFNGFSSSAVGVTHPTFNPNAIYMNVPYVPQTQRPFGPFHMSLYTTTDGNTGNVQDMGAYVNNSALSILITGRFKSGANSNRALYVASTNYAEAAGSPGNGYYIARYDGSASPKGQLVRQGINTLTANQTTAGLASISIAIGGIRDNDNAARVVSYPDKQYQFATVGGNLTFVQMELLNGVVQTFQSNVDAAMGTSRRVVV
jgi:hypothetical protein